MNAKQQADIKERLARIRALASTAGDAVDAGRVDGVAYIGTHLFDQMERLKKEIHEAVLGGPPANEQG